MLRIAGLVITVLGLVAAAAGAIWSAVWPHPDANIGAGMLVVLGLPVAGVGLVLAIVGEVLVRRARR